MSSSETPFAAAIDKLNPPQREAVLASDGPLMVIAGAGSGKTRVIAHRVAHLIRERGVPARNIFAATFTNKAAAEMRQRVHGLLAGGGSSLPLSINTFHALCSMILRSHAPLVGLSKQFLIADESDSRSCMKEVLKEMGVGKEEFLPNQALWVVSQCKMRLRGSDAVGEVINSPLEDKYALAFDKYQKALRAGDAADFDDLINLVVQLFEENPDILNEYQDRSQYLLVDEYQDTNHAQFKLVSLLAAKHRNVCVVGDEDQSIYSWRGADLSNLLDFQKHYPGAKLIKLEQNYRSTGNVLAAAATTIARNAERIGKTLWTSLGDGLPIGLLTAQSDRQEAASICWMIKNLVRETHYDYRDVAIFYRVNWLSRVYEDALRDHEIPYQIVGGSSFYDRMEVRDLVSYLQFASNPRANLAFLRIINKPRRGVGQKTLDGLMEEARHNGLSLYDQVAQSVAEGAIKGKAKGALTLLSEFTRDWVDLAQKESPSRVLRRILDDTGYKDSLGDENSLEVKSRLENIDQLEASLVAFELERDGAKIFDWLESVALASAQDDITDGDCVSLMSLHAAKGLEYPAVFMAGMEDPIFPNQRAVRERGNDEEERRLFYVGITRAMRLLVLSRAETRVAYGELKFNPPSPFLRDIPDELIQPAEMIDLRRIDQSANSGSRGSRQALEAAVAAQLRDAKAKAGKEEEEGGTLNSLEARVSGILRKYEGPAGSSPKPREERHWTPDSEEAASGGRAFSARRASSISRRGGRQPFGLPRRGSQAGASGTGASPSSSRGAPASGPLGWARIGTRVEHEIFGAGLVVGESGSASQRRLLVEFDEDGRQRELLAQHAKLKPAG